MPDDDSTTDVETVDVEALDHVETMDNVETEAKQHIDAMPAETALGNADPAGGGKGTPAQYVAKHQGQGGK